MLALLMVISHPTNPTQSATELSSGQCCVNASSDQTTPAAPFRQPINPLSLQIVYGLAPRLDTSSSEDEGEEPDEKNGGGGHQTQPNKPPFHRS